MRARRLGFALASVAAGAGGVLAYTVARVQGRATGDVSDYLAASPSGERPVVVAGASIVRGRASVDFVQVLRERFPSRAFVNAGVNCNVAWELIQRLDRGRKQRGLVAIHDLDGQGLPTRAAGHRSACTLSYSPPQRPKPATRPSMSCWHKAV